MPSRRLERVDEPISRCERPLALVRRCIKSSDRRRPKTRGLTLRLHVGPGVQRADTTGEEIWRALSEASATVGLSRIVRKRGFYNLQSSSCVAVSASAKAPRLD